MSRLRQMFKPIIIFHEPTEKEGWLDIRLTRSDGYINIRIMPDGYTTGDFMPTEGEPVGDNTDLGKLFTQATWHPGTDKLLEGMASFVKEPTS